MVYQNVNLNGIVTGQEACHLIKPVNTTESMAQGLRLAILMPSNKAKCETVLCKFYNGLPDPRLARILLRQILHGERQAKKKLA